MAGFLEGFSLALSPLTFGFLVLGTAAGIVIGAIPGLSGAMAIALMLPMTFYMSPENSVSLLIAIYVGAVSGGLISATLLRIPGTPAAIMTTLDGYPMAKAGNPGRALGLGIGASVFGGLFSWGVLVTVAHPLSEFAIRLKPFDYFSLVLTALVLIASVSQGSVLKALASGAFGMLLTMPGVDPATGDLRLTFGYHEVDGGLSVLPVLVGIYAVGQILAETINIGAIEDRIDTAGGRFVMSLSDWKSQAINLLRSSVIGTWIGIVPAIGSNVGSIVSYTVARATSRTPEKFGTGFADGIVASESANNATVGGALVPLISLGIPGSVVDVFLLGALMIQGIQPGPLLFTNNPSIVYVMMAACLIANILMFAMMTVGVPYLRRLTEVPKCILFPIILVFCVVGAYAEHNRVFDVWLMIACGILGFALERTGFSLASLVIGFILAPIAEESLRAGLMLSGGSYVPLLTQPFSAVCLVVAVGLLSWSVVAQCRAKREAGT